MEGAFRKLFIMNWNEIVNNQEDYNEHWQENLHSDDLLLRFKQTAYEASEQGGNIKTVQSRADAGHHGQHYNI